MTNRLSRVALPLFLCFSLFLSACGSSPLVNLLDGVAIATAVVPAAVAALELTGEISAMQGEQINVLARTAAADTSKAIVDAESGKPAAQIATMVISEYANLPASIPGLSPQGAAIVQTVLVAVNAVIGSLSGKTFSTRPFSIDQHTKVRLDQIRQKCLVIQSGQH